MANMPIHTIKLRRWDGGLNLEADDATIERNELSFCENVEIGLNGELRKRKGYATYSTAHNASLATISEFIFHWNQLGSATDYTIIVDADGDVYKSTGTSFSAAADFDITASTDNETHPVAGAVYANVFYLTSLRANAQSFNGTSWTAYTDYTLDGGGTEFPRAAFLAVKHERMFAANINNNGTRERSRIRWSNVADATTWDSNDWIDVDPDDGTEVRKILPFADGIVIFKDNSTFFLSGVDANSFTLFPVDSTVGTQSPGTVVASESAVFFFDDVKGVYSFDGTGVKRISDKINTQLLSDASYSNRKYHTAFFFKQRYYLSLHDGTDKNITYVYDTRTDSWFKYTNGFYDAVEFDGNMYVVGATDSAGTTTQGVCTYLSGESDNTVSYTAKAVTGWIGLEDENHFNGQRFRIRSVDVVAVEGAGTLTVNLYEDFKTSSSVSGSASMDNNNYDHVHRRVVFTPALNAARTTFQLEFSLASTTDTFTIAGVDVQVSPRRKQRGGNI